MMAKVWRKRGELMWALCIETGPIATCFHYTRNNAWKVLDEGDPVERKRLRDAGYYAEKVRVRPA